MLMYVYLEEECDDDDDGGGGGGDDGHLSEIVFSEESRF
jgi:hypothetical protein